jgi:hypothetical protein
MGGDNEPFSRLIASALALIAALASIQLLSKHRYMEVYYARFLSDIENAKQLQAISQKPAKPREWLDIHQSPSGTLFLGRSGWLRWSPVLRQ